MCNNFFFNLLASCFYLNLISTSYHVLEHSLRTMTTSIIALIKSFLFVLGPPSFQHFRCKLISHLSSWQKSPPKAILYLSTFTSWGTVVIICSFLFLISAVLLAKSISILNRFLKYGKVALPPESSANNQPRNPTQSNELKKDTIDSSLTDTKNTHTTPNETISKVGSTSKQTSTVELFLNSFIDRIPCWTIRKSKFSWFYMLSLSLSSINLLACFLFALVIIIVSIPYSVIDSTNGRPTESQIEQVMSFLNNLKQLEFTILTILIQFILPAFCIFFQSMRRLYECLYVQDFSSNKSKIQLPHFFAGIAFYIAINWAIFVSLWDKFKLFILYLSLHSEAYSGSSVDIIAVTSDNSFEDVIARQEELAVELWTYQFSFLTCASIVLIFIGFIGFSWAQYLCHKHLASLIKYSLPSIDYNELQQELETSLSLSKKSKKPDNILEPTSGRSTLSVASTAFQNVACPHYLCEIAIYLSITCIVLLSTLSFPFILPYLGLVPNYRYSYEDSLHDFYHSDVFSIFYERGLQLMTLLSIWVVIDLTASAQETLQYYKERAAMGDYNRFFKSPTEDKGEGFSIWNIEKNVSRKELFEKEKEIIEEYVPRGAIFTS